MNEFQEQATLFHWAEIMSRQIPELKLLNASANGIKVSIGLAMKMKRAGMLKKGYPDIFLPVRRKNYSGLFIELKVKKNKLSDYQKEWFTELEKQNYLCICCYGWKEASIRIIDYLKS